MRGVNLMRTILANSEPGACNHYFIGSTPQNLINLRNELSLHYPQANIVGTYSPPFTKGNEWIHDKSIDFKASIADFVWIGLGTPKQDILMGKIAEYFPNAKAILAVGAAFDFLTQNRKEANQIIITLKLEWLYRLLQEPRRLWKRYTLFMLYFVLASRFVDFKDQ
jgi:N-acetylglucosaminyldiphosphoundecaprenol N-acetyl-beta-D-mannosaminyltransferase